MKRRSEGLCAKTVLIDNKSGDANTAGIVPVYGAQSFTRWLGRNDQVPKRELGRGVRLSGS